jgi:transcriptional regulator with XRE-family HTH domain
MTAKKRTPEMLNRILELREEGLSYAQIGKKLGISSTTAHRISKESSAKPGEPEPKAAAEKIEILQSEPEIEIPEPEDLVTPPAISPKRPGRGRPTLAENGEAKRITTVAILPSIYDATRKICYVQRRSISDVINRFLEEFVAQNQNDLKKY